MQEHEAHGSSRTEITTGGTGQLEALADLIRSDAFAMTFQSVKQYREALINAAAVQGEPKPDEVGMVNVPRELLERWAERLEGHGIHGYGWEKMTALEIRAILEASHDNQ